MNFSFLSVPDPEDKFNKELKSVAEEDALRKLLSSDEDDDEENKSEHESEKEEKKQKEREELKEKKKLKKSKQAKKGSYPQILQMVLHSIFYFASNSFPP